MEILKEIQEYFQGKKTYIVGVLTAFYGVLVAFDFVNFTAEQEKVVFIFVLTLFGMTLNAKLERKL